MSLSSPELSFDPLAAYKKDGNRKAYEEGYERIFGDKSNSHKSQNYEEKEKGLLVDRLS